MIYPLSPPPPPLRTVGFLEFPNSAAWFERQLEECCLDIPRDVSVSEQAVLDPNAFQTYASLLLDNRVAERNGNPYEGTPLSGISNRGKLLEMVVRKLDERMGAVTVDVQDLQGKGKNKTPYDYVRIEVGKETRVEVKTGRLSWNESKQNWYVVFSDVKFEEHDQLLLGFYLPDKFDVYVHNGKRGPSKHGKRTGTTGGTVSFNGPRNEKDW